MPYIPTSQKLKVKEGKITNAGELNYAIHQLISNYLENSNHNYQACNDVMGVLSCVSSEFYRRIVAPYEDKKIVQNGDVEPYSLDKSLKIYQDQ